MQPFFLVEKGDQKMENKNLILAPEGGEESTVIDKDDCAFSNSAITKTVGKITYRANLHFKEQGQSFSQKLKRVLKADSNT